MRFGASNRQGVPQDVSFHEVKVGEWSKVIAGIAGIAGKADLPNSLKIE